MAKKYSLLTVLIMLVLPVQHSVTLSPFLLGSMPTRGLSVPFSTPVWLGVTAEIQLQVYESRNFTAPQSCYQDLLPSYGLWMQI